MIQYSDEILSLIGGPELADLTMCGANELPILPNYLDAAIWNHICRSKHPDAAITHLSLAILKQTNAAAESYRTGREHLIRFVDGVQTGEHRILAYLSAAQNFEHCIGAIWKALEAFNRLEHKVLNKEFRRLTLYESGDNSDLNRISDLNGVAKHYSIAQATQFSAHVWISNFGLHCAISSVCFNELVENILALSEINRQTFIEIPREALARQVA